MFDVELRIEEWRKLKRQEAQLKEKHELEMKKMLKEVQIARDNVEKAARDCNAVDFSRIARNLFSNEDRIVIINAINHSLNVKYVRTATFPYPDVLEALFDTLDTLPNLERLSIHINTPDHVTTDKSIESNLVHQKVVFDALKSTLHKNLNINQITLEADTFSEKLLYKVSHLIRQNKSFNTIHLYSTKQKGNDLLIMLKSLKFNSTISKLFIDSEIEMFVKKNRKQIQFILNEVFMNNPWLSISFANAYTGYEVSFKCLDLDFVDNINTQAIDLVLLRTLILFFDRIPTEIIYHIQSMAMSLFRLDSMTLQRTLLDRDSIGHLVPSSKVAFDGAELIRRCNHWMLKNNLL
ncbi:hypothetical protein BC833DRAFT_108260 [Globomyces pollinis-pini]|nr:hypothetical protein BC833DRAFT_108260 [Globomyces pollinis-pini]